MEDRIKLGISSCLLGENVRWNGGHKLDRYLRDTLGAYVDFVPVCPEVEAGFGTPRETFRLVGDPESPRLMTTRSKIDHTERMAGWAARRVRELEKEGLCGFVFKCDSPSSGMIRVKVYSDKGMPRKQGVGIFARAFMQHFPLIPVEDDGRLHDAQIRENFIGQIFTLKRWRDAVSPKAGLGKLVDFHAVHKLLLMSHSPVHANALGKLVAAGRQLPAPELFRQYEAQMIEALRLKTTVKKNMNVLQHILGYFKKQLSADEKQELLEVFDRYRREYVPLIVPITLLNHYVRKYDQPYLKRQTYLNPHPIALKLRNHV